MYQKQYTLNLQQNLLLTSLKEVDMLCVGYNNSGGLSNEKYEIKRNLRSI